MCAQQARPRAEAWERRLYLPAYRYAEAARLVETAPQTIRRWYHGAATREHGPRPVLPTRQASLLSYMQVIDVAFVADFRRLGVRLNTLRQAHAYLCKTFRVEYPFSQLDVMTEGVAALAEYAAHAGGRALQRLIAADCGERLTWPEAIQERFDQFDYERRLAVRWHPRGRDNPVLVDPSIAFGAPIIGQAGVATWAIRERFVAGEDIPEIEEDFGVTPEQIAAALAFEGIELHAA
ncbi:MAG TPA: DUF433 domain-containing protein [Chloroflexota bacterium]|jgi:uncharacterized protein (DUF433 family)